MNKPLTIIIDTREQEPWQFCPSISCKLNTGDYSIVGFENQITIERKSKADFISTISDKNRRKRFYKELDRMVNFSAACVIVEAGLPDIVDHQYRGEISPASVIGTAAQISAELGIPVYFCGSRPAAVMFAGAWLRFAVRKVEGKGNVK